MACLTFELLERNVLMQSTCFAAKFSLIYGTWFSSRLDCYCDLKFIPLVPTSRLVEMTTKDFSDFLDATGQLKIPYHFFQNLSCIFFTNRS